MRGHDYAAAIVLIILTIIILAYIILTYPTEVTRLLTGKFTNVP